MATRIGNNGNNVLVGTRHDDTLIGLGGNDRLIGLAGDDVLRGGLGADRLFGGTGEDWADYRDAAAAVTANLSNRFLNTGEAAGDRFFSIERIRGSQFDDTLVGNFLNNVLEGGAGADSLDGGGGFDFARYKSASAGVTASLADPTTNTGDAAGDTYRSIEGLQGSNFGDTLTGDSGDNVLIGGQGADILNGGGGFDFARYELSDITTGVTASLADPSINTGDAAGDTYTSIEGLIGTRFSDQLFGDDAANVLDGGRGNDVLSGGLGDDALYGGRGNDRLAGGLGNDLLVGGRDKDIYQFDTALDASTNVDLIVGFSVRDDRIYLDDAIFANAGAVGRLAKGAFHIGAAAHDSSDRIIYNRTTGALYYDSDGNGAEQQVQFAQLSAKLALNFKDFVIF